jgi:hypothetical protein
MAAFARAAARNPSRRWIQDIILGDGIKQKCRNGVMLCAAAGPYSEWQTSKSLTTTRGGGFTGILSLKWSKCKVNDG